MEMPYCSSANIPTEKITEYLLSLSHPRGSTKARWFNTLGYDIQKPNELVKSLLSLACFDVLVSEETDYGTKYVIVGNITGPDGRSAKVKTIWMLSVGSAEPKLVTAYPSR